MAAIMKEKVFLLTWHIICECLVGMQTTFVVQEKRSPYRLDPKSRVVNLGTTTKC